MSNKGQKKLIKFLSVRLEPSEGKEFKKIADRKGFSAGELVRRLITRYLEDKKSGL